MSGAAGIAAAKNRRSRADPTAKPIINCSSNNGSCPMPGKTTTAIAKSSSVDPQSLQINGPMHIMQVIQLHEQRLNKIDDRLKNSSASVQAYVPPQASEPQGCDAECDERISALEEKVHILEEVIMNLQLTLTSVQNFAMETNLALMKLQKQSCPVSPTQADLPTLVHFSALTIAEPAIVEEPVTLSVTETN